MKYLNKTEAVVLSSKNYKEVDKIITFYTSEFGKIKIKARGVQKIKSKLNSTLQPFNLLEIFFVRGRMFPVIAECLGKERLIFYENNFKKIVYGLYLLDLVDNFTEEGGMGKHQESFNLLTRALKEINQENDHSLACFSFVIKFLSYLGYEPVLDRCVKCQKNITNIAAEEKLKFSFSRGGVICKLCFFSEGGVQDVSYAAIRFLYFLLKSNQRDEVNVSTKVKDEVNNLLDLYTYYLLGKDLRSKRFLLY